MKISKCKTLQGKVRVPGDKSISHRALLFGAIANGRTIIKNILKSQDVQATQNCLQAMGVLISENSTPNRSTDSSGFSGLLPGAHETQIAGVGVDGLQAPASILDCGNSGTTLRLLMGLLAGQKFDSQLTGDKSLQKRPMKRLADPLSQMGARFTLSRENYPPLTIHGTQKSPSNATRLKGIHYQIPIASAQVKTGLLLAGLFAEGPTHLTGALQSRDHTERMLPHFGVPLEIRFSEKMPEIRLSGGHELKGCEIEVPGDFSSAAFWLAGASLIPGSEVEVVEVSLNPTRTGFLDVLRRMGAKIEIEKTKDKPEPVGNIHVRPSELHGIDIQSKEIPLLIDEIPILAILATQAIGTTTVRAAKELRVKESDRIEAIATGLRAMGAQIETFEDGFEIEGPQRLRGSQIQTYSDHRIAMAFSIAGLIADGETEILGFDSVSTSYPDFYPTLQRLICDG